MRRHVIATENVSVKNFQMTELSARGCALVRLAYFSAGKRPQKIFLRIESIITLNPYHPDLSKRLF